MSLDRDIYIELRPYALLAQRSAKGRGSYVRIVQKKVEKASFPILRVLARLWPRSEVQSAQSALQSWQSRGIQAVALGEVSYPSGLLTIADPPPLLFYLGNLSTFLSKSGYLAIVGARRAGPQECQLAESLSKRLAQLGVCVVSGLAYGIDRFAHAGALAAGVKGATVAVLGSGLDRIYPMAHQPLSRSIVDEDGLLLSQFEPGVPPLPANFLNRNRIIAGLAEGVLVVQAARRSGSLATARYAIEAGRDVLAIPGTVWNPKSEGSNRLIQQGAHLINDFADILEIFPRFNPGPHKTKVGERIDDPLTASLTAVQQQILGLLGADAPRHCDELAALLPNADSLAADLIELELAGCLTRLPGNMLLRRQILAG